MCSGVGVTHVNVWWGSWVLQEGENQQAITCARDLLQVMAEEDVREDRENLRS